MVRRFTDATALLADLLDRHEGGARLPIAYPHYAGFASVTAADAFIRQIQTAERAGAVSIAWGRGAKHEQVAHVRLESSEVLHQLLNRAPISELAADAYSQLIAGLVLCSELSVAAMRVGAVWKRGKSWYGFFPSDVTRLRNAFILAQSIVDGQHIGVDYRTFSRRVAHDSKALERSEGVVVRLLMEVVDLPPGAKPREALRTLGLERFSPPLLISGRLNVGDANVSGANLRYFGITPGDVRNITFREVPDHVLTVENFASFNRHVIEADPQCFGTTIYVGGYPSLETQKALRTLTNLLPESTPIFHWSDIDIDGAWILQTIEQAIGRPVHAHLMSPDIAARLGTPLLTKQRCKPCTPGSGAFALFEYLKREDAKVLEQEELDPCLPKCIKA